MKISVIGCGKRFKNIYFEILKKLGHELSVWNRTKIKAHDFCKNNELCLLDSLEEIKDSNLILNFVPPEHQYEVIDKLGHFNQVMLVETPVYDQRIISSSNRIGTLEQWPFLPLEQFKEKIYSMGLVNRPYRVVNDGRSFDYHAMAQMRNYISRPLPSKAIGFSQVIDNPGVIIDESREIKRDPYDWTIGHVTMTNGAVISHDFSYNCKSHVIIPNQTIKCLSDNGSISTSRRRVIGNDYEDVDVRVVGSDLKPSLLQTTIEREGEVTKRLSVGNVEWMNPFFKEKFNDQQVAIATLIEMGIHGEYYPCKESFIDNLCINMIKSAASSGTTTTLRTK